MSKNEEMSQELKGMDKISQEFLAKFEATCLPALSKRIHKISAESAKKP